MARKKFKKITEVRTFANVFDCEDKGVETGLINYFSNCKVVTMELGCGQADYSINLALQFPSRKFIAIDRKPNRLWNASKNAGEIKVSNVAMLISPIEKLGELLKEIKAEEIWITFPDPYPRNGSIRKRLTHPRFLRVYKEILTENGIINLKTDDDTLYEYTLQMIRVYNLKLIKETNDLYAQENLTPQETIKTKYEKMHLEEGKKIKLVRFSF